MYAAFTICDVDVFMKVSYFKVDYLMVLSIIEKQIYNFCSTALCVWYVPKLFV